MTVEVCGRLIMSKYENPEKTLDQKLTENAIEANLRNSLLGSIVSGRVSPGPEPPRPKFMITDILAQRKTPSDIGSGTRPDETTRKCVNDEDFDDIHDDSNNHDESKSHHYIIYYN